MYRFEKIDWTPILTELIKVLDPYREKEMAIAAIEEARLLVQEHQKLENDRLKILLEIYNERLDKHSQEPIPFFAMLTGLGDRLARKKAIEDIYVALQAFAKDNEAFLARIHSLMDKIEALVQSSLISVQSKELLKKIVGKMEELMP